MARFFAGGGVSKEVENSALNPAVVLLLFAMSKPWSLPVTSDAC